MLLLPEVELRRSTTQHNVDLDVLCDWIEGSALFIDDYVSASDVVDILCEEEIYDKQELAADIVEMAWAELRRRMSWLGSAAAGTLESRTIRRAFDWHDLPAHAFCLITTFAQYYKRWAARFGTNYIEQGRLFESLVAESLRSRGWDILLTGWASGISTNKFEQIVSMVADLLREPFVNKPLVALYKEANDEGLDLVCYRPFGDNRGGKPVYLMQCASGRNWVEKLSTPNIDVWTKLINFSSNPQRAFAMPFALSDDEFFRVCNRVNGMLIDRYRLLSAGSGGNDWIPTELRQGLVAWLDPRVATLPTDSS